jgi:hypothetical protein
VSLRYGPQGEVLSRCEHASSQAEDDRGQRPHRNNLFGYMHCCACRCVGERPGHILALDGSIPTPSWSRAFCAGTSDVRGAMKLSLHVLSRVR